MKLILDVGYKNNVAKVVGGFFNNWEDDKLIRISHKIVENINEYVPGEFYKRELPCILEFLKDYDLEQIQCIIIDGFIFLDDNQKKD